MPPSFQVTQGSGILYPGELSFPPNTVSGSWGDPFSGSSRASIIPKAAEAGLSWAAEG